MENLHSCDNPLLAHSKLELSSHRAAASSTYVHKSSTATINLKMS